MRAFEMAIVGGGPVGLCAALAAAQHGLDVIVLEAGEDARDRDPRVFALSHATRLVLERLGAWTHVRAAHPIRTVHVSERGAFGAARLDAEMLALPALGYVVAQSELMAALRTRMREIEVPCETGARVCETSETADVVSLRYERNGNAQELVAGVVALAEGGAALVSRAPLLEREYGQQALTAVVEAQGAAAGWAYERFTGCGPIALLPLERSHALIWTVPDADAGSLLALDPTGFESALRDAYGSRLGAVRLLGSRAAFPLRLRFAHPVAGARIALIGNSAQTLHPVAGQGFNIGVRDAYELAVTIRSSIAAARGPADGLRRYRSRRRLDRAGGTAFTDFLIQAFASRNPVVQCARSAALAGLDAIAPAKAFLMRRMIFGAPH